MTCRMKDLAIAAQTSIEIEQISAPVGEIRALIEELEQELSANYPSEQRHGLALNAIFQRKLLLLEQDFLVLLLVGQMGEAGEVSDAFVE